MDRPIFFAGEEAEVKKGNDKKRKERRKKRYVKNKKKNKNKKKEERNRVTFKCISSLRFP